MFLCSGRPNAVPASYVAAVGFVGDGGRGRAVVMVTAPLRGLHQRGVVRAMGGAQLGRRRLVSSADCVHQGESCQLVVPTVFTRAVVSAGSSKCVHQGSCVSW